MPSALLAVTVAVLCFSLQRIIKLLSRKDPLRALPGPQSQSWLSGNLPQFYDPNNPSYHRGLVAKFGGAVRVPSLFGKELIYLSDALVIQQIFGKAQDAFDETESFFLANSLVFGPSILSAAGDLHRKHRKMLTPLFSTTQMRQLFPVMNAVADRICDNVRSLNKEGGPEEIDMASWISRAAIEIIGRAGFGYSFDDLSLEGARRHRYTKVIKQLPLVARRLMILMIALPYFDHLAPRWLLRSIAGILPWSDLHEIIRIVDVIYDTSKEIYDHSKMKQSDGTEIEKRKDILSVLLRNNADVDGGDRLQEEEIIGQLSAFTFAGSDTSSSVISRMLHILAAHPEVQTKLRAEINAAKDGANGELDYVTLMKLPYLDAVCRETLRLHPPAPFQPYQTTKDTVLPLGKPLTSSDGKTKIHELVLPKGTDLVLGLESLNRSKDVWGLDAEDWKPERWMVQLPSSVADAKIPGVYSNMMTFFAGGRSCIGLQFALMEIKVMLSKLVSSFEFALPHNKEIVWLMSGIVTPGVKGEEDKAPYLPLRVMVFATSVESRN